MAACSLSWTCRLRSRCCLARQQELIAQYGSGAVSAVKAVVSIYKNTADPFAKVQVGAVFCYKAVCRYR